MSPGYIPKQNKDINSSMKFNNNQIGNNSTNNYSDIRS